MKIAIITETFLPSTDGIVTRLTACIRYYLQAGHDVRVIAPDLGVYEFDRAVVKGVPARTLPFYRSKKFALPSRKVKTYLEEYQPDIVHNVNPALLGVSGIYYARKMGLPIVASYHTNIAQYLDYYRLSPFKGLIWWYFRKLHNKADLNVCTSRSVQEELIQKRFRNVVVWKRGVDTELFRPDRADSAMRERLSRGHTDKILLLYVGRLAAEKEIEKIRSVLDSSDQFVLAIVGDGPYRSELEQHFAGTNTVFTGFMHGEQLAAAFASSDVFIFPSTTETLGLVIMEAMASGLPVVAADSGPTHEQIRNEVTGLLYDPDDADHFVQTVLRFRDDTLRKRLSAAAYEEIATLGWSHAAEQMLNLYKQVAMQREGVKDPAVRTS